MACDEKRQQFRELSPSPPARTALPLRQGLFRRGTGFAGSGGRPTVGRTNGMEGRMGIEVDPHLGYAAHCPECGRTTEHDIFGRCVECGQWHDEDTIGGSHV